MADDEKTLHIRLSYDGGSDQKPPADSPSSPPKPVGPPSPTAPPSPQAPAAPNGPTSPPPGWNNTGGGGQGGTPRPPATPPPPVGVPQSPAPVPTGGGNRIPIAPAVGATPGAGAASAAGAGAMAAVGGALVVVGAVVAALGTLVTVTQVVVAGMSSLADKLGDLDPGIATANAVADVRKLMGNMQQAQQLSGEMQGFVSQRTDLELSIQRIETSLVKDFSPAIKASLAFLEKIAEGISLLIKLAEAAWDAWKEFEKNHPVWAVLLAPGLVAAEKIIKWLNLQEGNDQNEDAAQFQKDLLDALDPHRADIRNQIQQFDSDANGREIPRRFGK